MKENIYLLAFGTFGNPNGFRQSPFIAADMQFFKSIKTFDLNTNAIKLFQGNSLYSIRKEVVKGVNTVAYSVYTFAKEQNSDRGGTFIGSSLLFANEIADENITISKLNEFHQILVSKNAKNDVILVDHSDKFSAKLPKDFDKLNFNLSAFDDLNNFNSNNKILVVFCETTPNKLNYYFREGLKLLNNYDSIYFTNSEDIAKFVNEKGIYKLIQNIGNQQDFEEELIFYRIEKEKIIKNQISEFEKEKESLEISKKKHITDLERQFLTNQTLHEENFNKIEASRKAISGVNQNYVKFESVVFEAISLLKSGHKIDEVKLFYAENKRNFITSLNSEKEIINFKITALSDVKIKTDLKINNQTLQNLDASKNISQSKSRNSTKPKYNIYKIVSFCSLILWLGSLVYFFCFYTKKNISSVDKANIIDSINAKNITKNSYLNPFPNDSLSKTEYKNVAKKLKESLELKKIVEIIFTLNPEGIKSYYRFQEADYRKLLYEKNPNSFFIKQNDTLYNGKDSIRVIPSIKIETKILK